MASNDEMSTSFGSAAGAYESGRPDYPIQAVDWMLQPVAGGERSIRVADVGAGTGKLTRVARELGAEVVAIDPDPQMLAVLREHVHGVPFEALRGVDGREHQVVLVEVGRTGEVPASGIRVQAPADSPLTIRARRFGENWVIVGVLPIPPGHAVSLRPLPDASPLPYVVQATGAAGICPL